MPATLDPAWALICMDQWRSDCAIKSGLNSALNSYAKVCRLCATRSEGQRSDFSQPRTAGNVRSLASVITLKPAIRYRFKTGQRDGRRRDCFTLP
jgi:hypothetical protein